MKTSVACFSALFLGLCGQIALAQTSTQLPSPLVLNYYTNANCRYNPPAWTSATGFTADGNYVTGLSRGYVACGHSGRGSNLVYTYYCMTDVWDLLGNLVSVTVLPNSYWTCPNVDSGATYTNAGGYEVYTVTNIYYGYIQSRYAVLVTP
jgi:hypothetical protein